MSLLLVLIAVTICFTVCETKERIASLVVLPPLVLGYDELYQDVKMKPAPPKRREMAVTELIPTAPPEKEVITAPPLKKEPPAASKTMVSVASSKTLQQTKWQRQKKTKAEEKPQRSIIIDTKGRRHFRRNYRSLLKKQKKQTNAQHVKLIR